MSSSSKTKTPQEIEIRKLRKKLRQIENLERLDRDLLEEEVVKILKKNSIRERLRKLLIEETEKQAKIEAAEQQQRQQKQIEGKAIVKEKEILGRISSQVSKNDQHKKNDKGKKDEEDEERKTQQEQPNIDLLPPPSYSEFVASEQILKEKEKKEIKNEKQSQNSVSNREQESKPEKKYEEFSKKTDINQDSSRRKRLKKAWNRSQFIVYDLEGHNDLVTGIDSNEEILVTCSRDTTLRSWSLKDFEELHIFGGHSGSVTCLKLLSAEESQKIGESLFCNKSQSLYLLSGSLDCSFKIWHIKSGQMMKSMYTYNPVTQINYFDKEEIFITASDGGKLQFWNLKSAENIFSEKIYEESITGLSIEGDQIYTSSSEGVLKVHEWRNKKLVCLYKSEQLRMADMRLISQRNIRCLAVFNQRLYYGDGGINIKVVHWKKGIVDKLLNHTEDFGVTDAISCSNDSIFASAYDIDNGLAYINVRTLPEGEYLGTVNDEATGQIKCIHCCRGSILNGNLLLAVGGLELKVWKLIASSRIPEDLSVIPGRYLPKLSMTGSDSGTESEYTEDEEEEEEEEEDGVSEREDFDKELHLTNKPGWFGNCTVL